MTFEEWWKEVKFEYRVEGSISWVNYMVYQAAKDAWEAGYTEGKK
jgi:hypothetical protein